jgi:hypothetical protein
MPRSINGGVGGGSGGGVIGLPTSTKPISTTTANGNKHHNKHRTNGNDALAVPKQEPPNDDLASTDEIKVYKDEGAGEEEEQNLDNLNEDKIGLVNETEDVSPPIVLMGASKFAYETQDRPHTGPPPLQTVLLCQTTYVCVSVCCMNN